MPEANWYWTHANQQAGPAPLLTLARLILEGQLHAADLVWQEGMPAWLPADQVPALLRYLNQAPATPVENLPTEISPGQTPATEALPVEALPVEILPVENQPVENLPAESLPPDTLQVETIPPDPAPTASPFTPPTDPSSVSYYNPSGALPPRAAIALQRHAQPRGDVGDWPLSDDHLSQFDAAFKIRKRIIAAASLYKLLLLLTACSDLFTIIACLATLSFGGPRSTTTSAGFLLFAVILIGFSALYYITWKATLRSQAWAPLTMGILFSLAGLGYFIAMTLSLFHNGSAFIGSLIPLLFLIGFAVVSFRAVAAVPQYLHHPAWIQELLSKTNT
jgi:hypothetical protein